MKAESITKVLPDSRWIGACLGRAQVSLSRGHDAEEVARELYEGSSLTLTRSREIVARLQTSDFTDLLEPRKKTGSAENPVTKLFPAAVTERQFLDEMDRLRGIRPPLITETSVSVGTRWLISRFLKMNWNCQST